MTEQETMDYIPTKEEHDAMMQNTQNEISKQYLSSTDWYVTRFAETGVEVPADVATKRAEARAAVVD